MYRTYFIALILTVLIPFVGRAQTNDTTWQGYSRVDFAKLDGNTYQLIANDWMLITGGTSTKFNTMTASWGGFGCLWNLPVTFIFVKPQRYTYGFLEESGTYTLSFFDHDKYEKALLICGTKSGRDGDKVKEAGLTPKDTPSGMKAFDEARVVIECKIVYKDFLDPEFIGYEKAKNWYAEKDYHKMYVGQVLNVWIKDAEE